MNFYAIVGRQLSQVQVLALTVDRATQDDLTSAFVSLAEGITGGELVAFDPGYRPEPGEIVTIAKYELPSFLSSLTSHELAGGLASIVDADLRDGVVRGIVGVEWKSDAPSQIAFQRVDSSYILRPEQRRLMISGGRFVRDDRPGLEVADRLDAVVASSTLYVSSWNRAHALLDLSAWLREATLTEAASFVEHKKFLPSKGFDVSIVADSWVRRKIVSISSSGFLERADPVVLKKYAAKFNLRIEIVKGKIVLPSEKKMFKQILNLLDQDLLSFEPTNGRWVVNSKRPA